MRNDDMDESVSLFLVGITEKVVYAEKKSGKAKTRSWSLNLEKQKYEAVEVRVQMKLLHWALALHKISTIW